MNSVLDALLLFMRFRNTCFNDKLIFLTCKICTHSFFFFYNLCDLSLYFLGFSAIYVSECAPLLMHMHVCLAALMPRCDNAGLGLKKKWRAGVAHVLSEQEQA